MDCNAYRILITGYIDGELSDDEMQMLKTHLQTCKSCFAYLIRAEAMKTVLKRCRLLQDVPKVPPDFAHNVSVILRGVVEQEKISLGAKVRTKYRKFILGIAEKWVGSLKARPFAWITSVSCLFVLLAGIVFVNIFRTVYDEDSIQLVKVAPKPVMQVAQKDKAPVEKESVILPAAAPELRKRSETETPALFVEDEPIQFADTTPESVIRAAKRSDAVEKKEDQQPLIIEVPRDQFGDSTEFLELAEESFTRVVKSASVSVEGYVYLHVIEVSQEQFIDDAVFAGYVQSVSFE